MSSKLAMSLAQGSGGWVELLPRESVSKDVTSMLL
jgi:hypothetical protein